MPIWESRPRPSDSGHCRRAEPKQDKDGLVFWGKGPGPGGYSHPVLLPALPTSLVLFRHKMHSFRQKTHLALRGLAGAALRSTSIRALLQRRHRRRSSPSSASHLKPTCMLPPRTRVCTLGRTLSSTPSGRPAGGRSWDRPQWKQAQGRITGVRAPPQALRMARGGRVGCERGRRSAGPTAAPVSASSSRRRS